jgi:hypothetical protein
MKKIEEKIEIKRFIQTSFPHSMGLRNFVNPEPFEVQGGREGSKKNPQPPHGRLGILPACTLHSLILEDFFVKNIQAGFLTFPPFQQPSRLELVERQWLCIAEKVPFSVSEKGGITAAGPSPTFPV